MTKQARSRQAFEKAARAKYDLNASQAREVRKRFESYTGRIASAKEFKAHPRIAQRQVKPAKAAVTRAINKARGGRGKRKRPPVPPVPPLPTPPDIDEEPSPEVSIAFA
jgi:hypothetical protein